MYPHDNSSLAYADICRRGIPRTQRRRICWALLHNGGMTRQELEKHFVNMRNEWGTPRFQMSSITPRVTALLENEDIIERGFRINPHSDEPNSILYITDKGCAYIGQSPRPLEQGRMDLR